MSEQVGIIRVSHNDPRVTALHAEKDAELEPRYRAYYAAHPEHQGRSDETLDPETILTVLLAVHGNTAVGTVMLRALPDRLEVKRLIVGKNTEAKASPRHSCSTSNGTPPPVAQPSSTSTPAASNKTPSRSTRKPVGSASPSSSPPTKTTELPSATSNTHATLKP
nr:hypothetical protein [Dermabacter vaginalis]